MIRREFVRLLAGGSALLVSSRALAAVQQETKEIELRVEGMI